MENLYTFTIFSENKPGVLYRIANVFLRRKVNIEGLNVVQNQVKKLAEISILVKETPEEVNKTTKQISRIIEVIKATAQVASEHDINKFVKES